MSEEHRRSIDHLLSMAQDIASYFAADPDPEARVAGIASHLERFWDPRMRRKLIAYLQQDGEGIDPVLREAVLRVAAHMQDHPT